MFIFVGDESNVKQSREAQFFIYGCVIIAGDKTSDICKRISRIRDAHSFARDAEFKFDSRSRPAHLSHDEFTLAKNQVLEMCQDFEVRFMAYAVHHEIARNRDSDLYPWALNTLLLQFDFFLQRKTSNGVCLVDRFRNDLNTLKRIHQQGVDPEVSGGSRLPRRLENVLCYGTISIGTTHLATVVDIVLGAFRYCVNKMNETKISLQLYRKVRPLLLCEPGNPSRVEEWGLFLRPREVNVPDYRQDYGVLLQYLKSLG